MLKVGSKFYTFDELSRRLEEFQELEQVQLWVRDSRTVVAAAKRARRKSLNPALKYAELTYSCVFGGRRPSDQTKTHNQTSAGGCPFKVRLSTSNDGQALVVKEICHDHNHEPGKKLHEEPRRLYKKTTNRTTVRKPVRYIVNKQRVTTSTGGKSKGHKDSSESSVQLGQSPFHHLHLHQQQYQQQQQQIKLQLQHHLQQQQQQQQQLRQKQAEIIQLDSPDHIDTPDHLSSPDLSTTFDSLGSLNNSVDQYTYLPPSPISPSLSSGCPLDCEEEERLEPILDLEEALEEALGDLDSVGSMEVDANLRLTSVGSSNSSLVSQSEAASADEHTGPPPAKRHRGRPRKQSFTGNPPKGDKTDAGEKKEGDSASKPEDEFLGFSPGEKGKTEMALVSRAEVAQANAMARQLHVYKPGIDFVPGARLEVLDARDNNWYLCKVVEVDWGELDILVHYERWSNRFDEWLKMDSTRIRPVLRSSTRKDNRRGMFQIGDKVTARWAADGKRYQAHVTKTLGDGQYEVLFFDGVSKIVRSGALTKSDHKGEAGDEGEDVASTSSPKKQNPEEEDMMLLSPANTTTSSTDSRPSSPEPEMRDQPLREGVTAEELSEVETLATPIKKNIFDVEIIEQKRKPKRKAAVEELFQSLKRKRRYEFHGKKDETPPSPKHQSAAAPSPKHQSAAAPSPKHQSAAAPGPHTKKLGVRRKGRDSMAMLEEDLPTATSSKSESSQDASEGPSCESPMPTQSLNTILMEMEDGWKKCCVRRTHGTTAGKWDLIYLTPEGKKIRNKNDIAKYFEEAGMDYDPDNYDFSVKGMKDIIEAHLQEHKEIPVPVPRVGQIKKDSRDVARDSKDSFCSEAKDSITTTKMEDPVVEQGGSSSKTTTPTSKKLEIKRSDLKTSDTKSSEVPRMKIEIPIMPKTEPLGSLASSLLHPTTSISHGSSHSESHSAVSSGAAFKGKSETAEPITQVTPTSSALVSSGTVAGISEIAAGGHIRSKQNLKKEPVRDKPSGYVAPNEFVVCTEHNEHHCPKPGCGKSFRKENLLQMHIKHYHPEILKKASIWAPNVADLAYARTVGDHLDLTASPTHSSPPVEKPSKGDTLIKKTGRGSVSGSPGDAKTKTGEKKGIATFNLGVSQATTPKVPKEAKRKDLLKYEASVMEETMVKQEAEIEVKEELEDYVDDLEEGSSVLSMAKDDPDYIPSEPTDQYKKRERKEKFKVRAETRSKKRKSVPSESMSEDDQQETKAVTKYRYSKRKNTSTPKGSSEPSSIEVEEDTADTWVEGSENLSVQETSSEIINCGCGSSEEEGLMLQCDVCLCWQHGACYNIHGEDQVPDKYICSLCDHPRLERSSHKFRHHQDWLKEGRLPRFSFSRTRGDARLEACVRRGHELTANVLQLSQVLHSLKLKLHIAKEADHPKFVMWHRKWEEKNEQEKAGLEEGSEVTGSETMGPLPADLMDIVGPTGSSIAPSNLDGTDIAGSSLNQTLTNQDIVPEGLSGVDSSNAPTGLGFGVPTRDWEMTGNVSDAELIATQPYTTPENEEVNKTEDKPTSEEDSKDVEKVAISTDGPDDIQASTAEGEHDKKEVDIGQISEDNTPEAHIKEEKESAITNQEQTKSPEKSQNDKTNDFDLDMSVVEEEPEPHVTDSSESSLDLVLIGNSPLDSPKEKQEDGDNRASLEVKTPKLEMKHDELAQKSNVGENQESAEPQVGEPSVAAEITDQLTIEPQAATGDNEKQDLIDSEKDLSATREKVEIKDEVKKSKSEEEKVNEVPVEDMENVNDNDSEFQQDVENKQTGKASVYKEETEINATDVQSTADTKESEPSDVLKPLASEDIDEKDLTENLEDIDLPQTSDIEATDLPQAGDIDSPDVLDDDDSQLDDGELGLDLGGLTAAGAGGSDLAAALLSSQSELEQLVTQASSALSHHVPPQRQVVAPIFPEAERIEPVNCKLNLLEHVQVMQEKILTRFDEIEKQLEVLEAEMGLSGDTGAEDDEEESEERDPATLQARSLVKLILNDVNSMKNIAEFTS